ncbi:sugar phosphate isomerase/epimerase family protein, partial [Streptomyces decoyicus]|uniref:sugar phosphate isomerase/epimerase family protein n=1 Tax=Streptomyces decoyicus TaxID=249567 RepID=UPI0034840029
MAAAHEVKVCIEMHPHNLVFNPATLKRLVERTGATHIGAELDPSHLFWQGIAHAGRGNLLEDDGRVGGKDRQPITVGEQIRKS